MRTNTYRLAVALQAKTTTASICTPAASTPRPTASPRTSPSSRATAPVQTSASCRYGHMTPTRTCSDRRKQEHHWAAASSPATSPHSAAINCGGNAASSPPPSSTATPPRSPSAPTPARRRSVPLLRPRRLLPQPRLGTRALATRHHLVTARRNHAQRTRRPHQGRRRHRHQLRGRARDPPPGRRLTRRRAPGSPPRGPGQHRRFHRQPATENGDTTMSAFIVHPEHINVLIGPAYTTSAAACRCAGCSAIPPTSPSSLQRTPRASGACCSRRTPHRSTTYTASTTTSTRATPPSALPHRVVAARAPQCPALLPAPGG